MPRMGCNMKIPGGGGLDVVLPVGSETIRHEGRGRPVDGSEVAEQGSASAGLGNRVEEGWVARETLCVNSDTRQESGIHT